MPLTGEYAFLHGECQKLCIIYDQLIYANHCLTPMRNLVSAGKEAMKKRTFIHVQLSDHIYIAS